MSYFDCAGRWTALALGCALALLTFGCASSGTSLPDFPPYPPAQDFLAMQARAQAYHPSPPPVYQYDPRGQLILDHLNATVAHYRAEEMAAAQARARYETRDRAATGDRWEALRQRIEAGELAQTLRAQERGEVGDRTRAINEARYRAYLERSASAASQKHKNQQEEETNLLRHRLLIHQKLTQRSQLQILSLRATTQSLSAASAAQASP